MTARPHDSRRSPRHELAARLRTSFRELLREETGDVPGWVLVTLMTAGLVVLIWAVAGPALTSLFEQAIQRVSGL